VLTSHLPSRRTITSSYYHGSDAVVLVYDITQKETFSKIEGWMADIQLYGKDRVPRVLVGNKTDKDDLREVTINEAKELQSRADIKGIFETSALNGTNVDAVFQEVARQLIADKLHDLQPTTTIPTRLNPNEIVVEKKKKCNLL
jgi:GTPase SAR1 family protein